MTSRFVRTLNAAPLGLVSLMILSGCASVQPRYETRAPGQGGPDIASGSHYKSGTMKPYSVHGQTYYPEAPSVGWSETGLASWYGYESPNSTTATGEPFDTDVFTAAHKTLPLPCIADVTNLDTGKAIRVRVNDRGPFVDGRIIDLSRAAARELGVYNSGTARVRVTFLGPAEAAGIVTAYGGEREATPSGDDFSYIVQIGAFSQSDNAEAAQGKIDGARIRQRNGLYIVYLGPYVGADTAETHRQDAIDAGFGDAILRRDDR